MADNLESTKKRSTAIKPGLPCFLVVVLTVKIEYAFIASSELRESTEFKSSTRATPFTKKNCYHVKQACHILIAHIQSQKQTRKHKTENTFVQKMLEFTREILNLDDVLKNSQNIYEKKKKKKIHNLPFVSRLCSSLRVFIFSGLIQSE